MHQHLHAVTAGVLCAQAGSSSADTAARIAAATAAAVGGGAAAVGRMWLLLMMVTVMMVIEQRGPPVIDVHRICSGVMMCRVNRVVLCVLACAIAVAAHIHVVAFVVVIVDLCVCIDQKARQGAVVIAAAKVNTKRRVYVQRDRVVNSIVV